MGLSWRYTSPSVGNSNPAIMRRLVVLPQPDGPSIEKNSPSRICMVTFLTAATSSPAGPGKRLETSRSSTANSDMRRLLRGNAAILWVLEGTVKRDSGQHGHVPFRQRHPLDRLRPWPRVLQDVQAALDVAHVNQPLAQDGITPHLRRVRADIRLARRALAFRHEQ